MGEIVVEKGILFENKKGIQWMQGYNQAMLYLEPRLI